MQNSLWGCPDFLWYFEDWKLSERMERSVILRRSFLLRMCQGQPTLSPLLRIYRDYKIPISVRSGGHSYTCMSIRHDSLHFDMRRLKKVDLLKRTGYEVRRKTAISLKKVI